MVACSCPFGGLDDAEVVEPAQELVLLPQHRLLLTPVDALHRHLRRGALLGHSFFQNSDLVLLGRIFDSIRTNAY